MAAEREVGLDPLLERRQPQILEPSRLDARERLVGELGQRRPAPQGERLAQQARRARRARRRARRRRAARTAAGRPPPARPRARSPAAASRSIPAGSSFRSRETYAWSALTAVSGGSSPQSSSISRSRASTRFACSSKSASSARCFGASERKRPVAGPDLQRPEQPELHRASRRRTRLRARFTAASVADQARAVYRASTASLPPRVYLVARIASDETRDEGGTTMSETAVNARRGTQSDTSTARLSPRVLAGVALLLRSASRRRAPSRRAELHGLVGAGEPRAGRELGGPGDGHGAGADAGRPEPLLRLRPAGRLGRPRHLGLAAADAERRLGSAGEPGPTINSSVGRPMPRVLAGRPLAVLRSLRPGGFGDIDIYAVVSRGRPRRLRLAGARPTSAPPSTRR